MADVDDKHLEDQEEQQEPELEQQDEPTTADQEPEDQEEELVEDEDEDEEPEEEPQPKPSRREQLRIQQLLEKLKEEGPSSPKKSVPEPLDYGAELDADDEVINKLKSDREQYGRAQYERGAEEIYRFNRFETRLEVDAPKVEAKYPQLDKNSEEFDPVLASTINRMYLSFVGFDGKSRKVATDEVRYADYVEAQFELANAIAGAKIERTTENLRKQAGKAGLRPGGSGQKRLNLNKAPSEMTDEELDAIISSTIPRKR